MRRDWWVFATLLLFVAARPECGPRDARLLCDPVSITVLPGQTSALDNPCDNDWSDAASITLCDTFAGVWLLVTRRPTATTVSIRVAADAPAFVDEKMTLRIANLNGAVYETAVFLSTESAPPPPPLTVTATAEPSPVTFGGTVQLGVIVAGGTPPYHYMWEPLDPVLWVTYPPSLAIPIAQPNKSVDFGVFVTDAEGVRASDWIRVPVFPVIGAGALPNPLTAGESTTLFVNVQPADPSFYTSFQWTPSGHVANPSSQTTVASPPATTTYTLTATTIDGLVAVDSVTVVVEPVSGR